MEKTLKDGDYPSFHVTTSKTLHGKGIKLSKIQHLLPLVLYTNFCFKSGGHTIYVHTYQTFKF